MTIEPLDILLICGVTCLASTIQSAAGFGYALFAIPLLLWIGLPLPHVVAIVAASAMSQAILGARNLRAEIPWKLVITASSIRMFGVVAGLVLFKMLLTMDMQLVRMIVGGIICLLVLLQLLLRVEPKERIHWGWSGLAFLGSGFAGGTCGMGGPPMVLWAVAHNWTTQRTRGFLFASFAISIPIQILMVSVVTGPSILLVFAQAFLLFPLVWLGIRLGMPIGNRLPKETMRRIAFALLLMIGLSAILPGLVH